VPDNTPHAIAAKPNAAYLKGPPTSRNTWYLPTQKPKHKKSKKLFFTNTPAEKSKLNN